MFFCSFVGSCMTIVLCVCLCYCFILYLFVMFFFFFKKKTAYDMRISDWSSDVCSSDLAINSHNSPLACTVKSHKEARYHRLFPIEGALLPFVDEAHSQNGQKHKNRPETHHAYGAVGHGPREQESDFKIEHNEQDRNQVIAHVELHARIAEGLETALVLRKFFVVRTMRPQQPARTQQGEPNTGGKDNKQQNGKVLLQIHAAHPITISKLLDCSILRASFC